MKPFIFLALLILAASSTLRAEPEKKDPIDDAMDKAMAADPSTAGVVQAAAAADDKWQEEIGRAINQLEKAMSAGQWKALQRSQKAWKSYRDKEIDTQDAIFETMQGSMWRPVAATSMMKLDKSRALLLRNYIYLLSQQ